MSGRARGRVGAWVESIVDQGARALPDPLKKRIRLTNIAAMFAAVAMAASIGLDLREGQRWMPITDVIVAVALVVVPLLNRGGHTTASRVAFTALCTLLAVFNVIGVGRESGAELLLLSLIAIPFALFDLRERRPLLFGVFLPVLAVGLTEAGILHQVGRTPAGYSASAYHTYSTILAIAIALFAMYVMSRENARAERELRLDIAARQRAERELAETRQASINAAKMAALGEMSANVAHEVNNPLAAILLRAHRLQRLAAKDKLDATTITATARDIQGTVDRIRRIVDALRFFARQGDDDPLRPERVSAIVMDTVELCAQRFRLREIALEIDPIPEELLIECRGAQISQILLNLLSNAYDAVETGANGRVRIGVEANGEEVRISISDNGPGIPEEIAARIMEPFFTTKDIGRGTGLGLSVSKGIAESHGGRLELDRRAPGTRFVLTLPRSHRALEGDQRAEPSPDTHH
jgi:signal transduction histidine kinase